MRYIELFEGRDALLYRGIQKPEYAIQALESNEMLGTTSQRFWKNGERLKDDHPDYKTSFWMKGVSMTRDKNYAMQWGEVVFVIDQSILSQRYKIIPYNWGYSIPSGNNHKREKEEFVVTKKTFDSYFYEEDGVVGFDTKRFIEPGGSIKNLSSILVGIYVEDYIRKYYQKEVEFLSNHPKFLGYYDKGDYRKNIPPKLLAKEFA